MSHRWVVVGAINGLIAVAAGAFAAHTLKKHLPPEDIAIFETGAKYQMYHALALLAVGWIASFQATSAVQLAGWGFLVGIVLFSGSLYALALSGVRTLGMITPLGGVAFLVGWAALAVAAWRAK